MSVLIICPQSPAAYNDDRHSLLQWLDQRAVRHFSYSVIKITDTPQRQILPQQLADQHIIIAVSQYAVYWAQRTLSEQQQRWPLQACYCAIGHKTAKQLQHQLLQQGCTQTVYYPQKSVSEHLLKLPPLSHVSGKNILILKGRNGRQMIEQQLRQAQANVQLAEVYHRQPITNPPQQLSRLLQQQIDNVLVTSGEQLDILLQQLDTAEQNYLKTKRLFLPSQRLVQHAQQIGFRLVHSTEGASNEQIITALHAYL